MIDVIQSLPIACAAIAISFDEPRLMEFRHCCSSVANLENDKINIKYLQKYESVK